MSQKNKVESFNSKDKISNLNISEEVIDAILNKLDEFEKGNLFLSTEMNLNKLADQFDTNVKYLSKIINAYKQKSFTRIILIT